MRTIAELARHVWVSPRNGNSAVVMGWGRGPGRVRLADLDEGTRYEVDEDDLTETYRPSEEEDYGYSWTNDPDAEVWRAVLKEGDNA